MIFMRAERLTLVMLIGIAVALPSACILLDRYDFDSDWQITDAGPDGENPDGGEGGTGGAGAGGAGGADAGGPCLSCSANLKSVLDCNGAFVEDCSSSGNECLSGKCVPACEGATPGSSVGCDYWAVKVLGDTSRSDCFAVVLTNPGPSAVKLMEVSFKGAALDPEKFTSIEPAAGPSPMKVYNQAEGIGPGDAAILYLAERDGDCSPHETAVDNDITLADVDGNPITGKGAAFHIRTDKPVVARQVLSFGSVDSGHASSTLLLPTSGWGTEYIAVSGFDDKTATRPLIGIVAIEPGTGITIKPKKGTLYDEQGAPFELDGAGGVNLTLNLGEYLQLKHEEVTGSRITSNRPVAVFGASKYPSIGIATRIDAYQQQLPPLAALRSVYPTILPPFRSGSEDQAGWQIVAAADMTMITVEGAAFSVPTLNAGDRFEIVLSGPNEAAFIIQSQDAQHPFYLASYMSNGSQQSNGGPEWVTVSSPQHYLNRYVLQTNPGAPEKHLLLVRPRPNGEFPPVDLEVECFGFTGLWKDFSSNKYQYKRLTIDSGANGICTSECCVKPIALTSTFWPFSVTLWEMGPGAAFASSGGVGYQLKGQ
jgi:hypothetical protein